MDWITKPVNFCYVLLRPRLVWKNPGYAWRIIKTGQLETQVIAEKEIEGYKPVELRREITGDLYVVFPRGCCWIPVTHTSCFDKWDRKTTLSEALGCLGSL